MPKLQRAVLVRLADKARNEKLAVGMGTWGRGVIVQSLVVARKLSCGNLSLYMVHSEYIDVDVNNLTKTMDPAP